MNNEIGNSSSSRSTSSSKKKTTHSQNHSHSHNFHPVLVKNAPPAPPSEAFFIHLGSRKCELCECFYITNTKSIKYPFTKSFTFCLFPAFCECFVNDSVNKPRHSPLIPHLSHLHKAHEPSLATLVSLTTYGSHRQRRSRMSPTTHTLEKNFPFYFSRSKVIRIFANQMCM